VGRLLSKRSLVSTCLPHSIPFHGVVVRPKCVWPYIYHRFFFEIRHPTSPSSAFPHPSELEALRTTPEQPFKLQTAMIHPFSFMERDSHPESIYELLDLEVDRVLIGTLSASFLRFQFADSSP
jgi:hypothetical protein